MEHNARILPDFVLTRYSETTPEGKSATFLELVLHKFHENGLKARFFGSAYVREGAYGTKQLAIPSVETSGTKEGDKVKFQVPAPGFLDEPGVRIVSAIEFEVMRGAEQAYSYRLLPMYVRGSRNQYWNNNIDPVLAHSGSGRIEVANGSSAETGLDYWDGVLVRPTLNFIDRNSLSKGAQIGLHRHESNQEMWLVESGEVEVTNGIATRSSADYKARRPWDSSGEIREVSQFNASGGWIETRRLVAGEYSVIVPNSKAPNTVCFHGLKALSESNTFTMGTKN